MAVLFKIWMYSGHGAARHWRIGYQGYDAAAALYRWESLAPHARWWGQEWKPIVATAGVAAVPMEIDG